MTDAAEVLDEPQTIDEIVTDADVGAIQNGIREAATGECLNIGESSLYYDASTMASLNAFSAVSLFVFLFFFIYCQLSQLSMFK